MTANLPEALLVLPFSLEGTGFLILPSLYICPGSCCSFKGLSWGRLVWEALPWPFVSATGAGTSWAVVWVLAFALEVASWKGRTGGDLDVLATFGPGALAELEAEEENEVSSWSTADNH